MRITCPTCAAAYDVPAELLAGARIVRCARCGSGWVPPADEAPPEQAPKRPEPLPQPLQQPLQQPLPDLRPDPRPELAVPSGVQAVIPPRPEPPVPDAPASSALARRSRQPPAVLLAWVASLAVLGAAMWAMIAWRTEVMHAWPPSERLYAALGLLRR